MTIFTEDRVSMWRVVLSVIAASLVGVLAGWLAPSPAFVRLVISGAALSVLVGLVVRSPRLALYLLLGWLSVLGLLRRLVTTLGSAGSLGDPLLLVAPAMWVLLAGVALSRGGLSQRTPLANTVLALTGLFAISAVNPLQGGLTVGLAGLLLVVPPMLAFWVGRGLVDELTLKRVVVLTACLAIPAAAYGLFQTFSGFPSWDARWIADSGYAALRVGAATRAFGSFASGAEYAGFLAIGIVTWLVLGRGLRLPLIVGALVLLGAALWFESSRGIIVWTAIAVVLLLMARWGVRLRWALLGVVAVLAAMSWLISRVAQVQFASNTTGALAAHQVQGLTDPFGQQSTLPLHIALVTNGLQQAIANPLGRGVGAITSAAGKYGGVVAGTEADPSNAAVALGALGLVGYVLLVLRGLPLAYGVAARRRDGLALAALGILAVTFLQWFNGAQYAVAPLPWLVLGWLDRQTMRGASDSETGGAQ